jgi:hypothetical protein
MEEVKSSSMGSSSGSKKSNTAIIIIVVVLAVLGVGGYLVSNYLAKKIGEKTAESIIGGVTGGKVDVNSDTGSVKFKEGDNSVELNGATWPSDMPAPKYSSGKVVSSSKLGSGADVSWSVTVSETTQDQFNTYKSSLVSAGWSQTTTDSLGEAILQYTKDNYDLTAIFDSSSNGVSLSVTAKQ